MISWGHNEVCHGMLTMRVCVLIMLAVHVPGVQGTEYTPRGGPRNDPVLVLPQLRLLAG